MYSLKFAHLAKEKLPDAKIYNFYIDIRAFGKGYEEFYDRILKEGTNFIRGKGAEVQMKDGGLVVSCEDTLIGKYREVPVDMVILATGLEARDDSQEVGRTFSISCGGGGFYIEKHPKLDPVATMTDGVFVAGCCQGPKDIPDTVAQASAAAARILALISKGKVEIEPITSEIVEDLCSGCRICNDLCPYGAIEYDKEKKVSRVIEAVCKACGTCAAACPSGAICAKHFRDDQIMCEIEGVMR
jgi:heterodisulfide reductase subunit A